MTKEVNDCVGCTSMGLPCIGAACPNRRREVHCCDRCGAEDVLYDFEGGEYCGECMERMSDD